MHDRRDNGADQRCAVVRRSRLDPVGQLERDDVAGPNPTLRQPGCDAPREVEYVTERPGPRTDAAVYDETKRRAVLQPTREQRSQRLVGPEALGAVTRGKLSRRAAQSPVLEAA